GWERTGPSSVAIESEGALSLMLQPRVSRRALWRAGVRSMENQLEPNDDLPAVPDVPVTDESLQKATQQVSGLDDDQVVKKIGTRTSMFGRVVTLLLIVGMIGLGAAWYVRDQ